MNNFITNKNILHKLYSDLYTQFISDLEGIGLELRFVKEFIYDKHIINEFYKFCNIIINDEEKDEKIKFLTIFQFYIKHPCKKKIVFYQIIFIDDIYITSYGNCLLDQELWNDDSIHYETYEELNKDFLEYINCENDYIKINNKNYKTLHGFTLLFSENYYENLI